MRIVYNSQLKDLADRGDVKAQELIKLYKFVNGGIDATNIAMKAIGPTRRIGGYNVGTFTISATGNKSITGVGFKPKFVKFTWLPSTATTASASGSGATDGTTQFATVCNDTTSAGAQESVTDGCILTIDTAGTDIVKASFVSFDSDGFTINVSVAGSSRTFAYEAYA